MYTCIFSAEENRQTLEADRLEAESRKNPRPLKVAVTAASSLLAYHLVQRCIYTLAKIFQLTISSCFSGWLLEMCLEIS